MESDTNTDVDKLITFGQMALEQGWYDQAREYFEQALALDTSNREAMKGLARVNEILSRKVAVEPINAEMRPEPPSAKLISSRLSSVREWIDRERKEYADIVAERKRLAAEKSEEQAREIAKRKEEGGTSAELERRVDIKPRGYLGTFFGIFFFASLASTILIALVMGQPIRDAFHEGCIFGLLFGLIMAAFMKGETISVTYQDKQEFLGRLSICLAEIGYHPDTQTDFFATFKPSFRAGLLAGRISVKVGANEAIIVGPRMYVGKLQKREQALAGVRVGSSRKTATAVEPVQVEPVEALHKAEPKWSVPEKEKRGSGMRTGAMVLGIIGGLAGIAGAFFALLVGGLGKAFGAAEAQTVIGLGWAAIPLSLLGIVGGAMAKAKPTAAGILMLISGIGGFIAISMGYIIAGPLLVIGGVFALIGRKERNS